MLLLKDKMPSEISAGFSDTENKNVLMLGSAGIISGYEDGSFRPLNAITREEAATLLYKAAQYMGCENMDPQGSSAEAGLLMKYYSVGGWGVFGTWEKNMLAPMAKWDRDKETKNQTLFGFYRIARSSFKKDNGCLTLDSEGTFTGGDKESIIEYIQKNKERLRNYQYLLLFYKLQETDAEQTSWERANNGRRY